MWREEDAEHSHPHGCCQIEQERRSLGVLQQAEPDPHLSASPLVTAQRKGVIKNLPKPFLAQEHRLQPSVRKGKTKKSPD